jgi:hypothetical protein
MSLAVPAEPGPGGHAPEPPRALVPLAWSAPTGSVIALAAGEDLQAALDRAQPGDAIALAAGATYVGPFTLPAKGGDDWITLRSQAEARLPPAGGRVTPRDADAMPKLVAATGSVITAAPAAARYRFVGIEVHPSPGVFLWNLVDLGSGENTLENLPARIVFERCYLHGDARRGTRRGIALNGRELAVVDSHLADFKEVGADSQGICGWGGPGPFRIENNHIEAAGENVMFGGVDPAIRGLVPSDIEVRRNHFVKPLSWKADEPGYEARAWTVKNLFELKNARRVLIEGNVFEHNWVQAQNGFAILFTVRNQDGHAPWSVVEDVIFRDNVVRHTGSGVNVLGRDDNAPSQQTRRISIANNLFLDVGERRWGGGGRLFQILDDTASITIEHNTAFQTGNLVSADGRPHAGFVFRDNIALHNEYGVIGTGTASGTQTLATHFPGADFRRNVIVGGVAARYPSDNFFPAGLEQVGFEDAAQGNYRLRADSPYRGAATDGKDVGVDFDALWGTAGALAWPASPLAAWPARPTELAMLDPAALRVCLPAIFWASGLLLLYANAGYPLLMRAWAALAPRPPRESRAEPELSVVVVAQDEAARIEARLENLVSLDYPAERLEIVLASDGSRDATVERARRYERHGVRIAAFERRRGKASVLNDVVPRCRGEIVVLADARQRFETGALRALVAPFADPRVGVVSGELILSEAEGGRGAPGGGLYWRFEKAIRRDESRVDSTLGATGAIYALRRELFEPIPADTLLDDVLVPARALKRGFRVVFAPAARAHDRVAAPEQEFTRKVRTIAGTFQLFARERWLLDPSRNRIWLQTVSHKLLRLLTPALLAAALAANLALAGEPLYRAGLVAQLAFYLAALIGWGSARARRASRLASVPFLLCLLAWATVVAFWRFARGGQPVTWAKAQVSTA